MKYDFDRVIDRNANRAAKYDERLKKFSLCDRICRSPTYRSGARLGLPGNRIIQEGAVVKFDAGLNIEDMVLITEQGCEVLTPKTPHYHKR